MRTTLLVAALCVVSLLVGWMIGGGSETAHAQNQTTRAPYGGAPSTFPRVGIGARSQDPEAPIDTVIGGRFQILRPGGNTWLLDTSNGNTWVYDCPPGEEEGSYGCNTYYQWVEK